MATEKWVGKDQYVLLTRKEAADIIGLLGAQLAGEPLIGNSGGDCPTVRIVDAGCTKTLLPSSWT